MNPQFSIERHKNNKYTKKGEIETSKGKSHIIKKIKYTKIIEYFS